MSHKLDNEPVENTTAGTSMDALIQDEQFPEVSENAIESVTEKTEQKAAEIAAEPVKLKKDGTPAKKRGRKAGTQSESKLHNPKAAQEKPSDSQGQTISSVYAATVTSGIIEQMGVSLISKDWQYTPEERASNIQAWEQTMDYYGGVNLSPPAALAMNHMGIILSRAASSNETRTKMQLAKAWAKNKWAKIRRKKDKDLKNAQPDRGNNNVGKNDIRNEKSGEPSKNPQ